MAGAVFGEVEVSLFVAGAVFGEIWNDSRSAKCCIFQYKMPVVGVKSNFVVQSSEYIHIFSELKLYVVGGCSIVQSSTGVVLCSTE